VDRIAAAKAWRHRSRKTASIRLEPRGQAAAKAAEGLHRTFLAADLFTDRGARRMKSLDFGRYALCNCVVAAMLTGCGGSQPPIGAPGAMPQDSAIARHTDRGKSWMLPEASGGDLLYATGCWGGTCVVSYPGGKLVASLNVGGYTGAGVCTDSSGNVFIGNDTTVVEYAHGRKNPIRALNLPGSAAHGCAVDPKTGDLAVVFNGASTNIAIFKNASGNATTYSAQLNAQYCGYDDEGNLFVDGLDGQALALAELPQGASAFTDLTVSNLGFPGQVQWDGQNITVQTINKRNIKIYRLVVSGSSATVSGTTSFDINRWSGASWISGSTVFIPFLNVGHNVRPNRIGVWKYPQGGKALRSIKKFAPKKSLDLQGVALSI
jgi:hypothetical protein